MAEFKVNELLAGEISAFSNSGTELIASASEITISGVSSLKTSVRYVEEHNAIIGLMKLYKQLIAKDASDLQTMKESAEELDAKIAGSTK